MKLEPDESTDELVYGEEPWNNGDYTWCEVCKAWVNFDYLEEVPGAEGTGFLHRGHSIGY